MQLIQFKLWNMHSIFYIKFYISSVLLLSVILRADCSAAEIPSDGFLLFAMDCCLLEVRATLAECSPESATGFFTDFCVLLAGGFAKGNAVDSCLSLLLLYSRSKDCEFWEQRFNRHFAKAPT